MPRSTAAQVIWPFSGGTEYRTDRLSTGSQAVGKTVPDGVQYLQTAFNPPVVESGLTTHKLSEELDQQRGRRHGYLRPIDYEQQFIAARTLRL